MNLVKLSSNIIDVITAMISNQTLVNYIGHDGDNPESQNIIGSTIAPKGSKERIFPFPFDTTFKDDVRSQVHVYYPSLDFVNNANANQAIVIFDIVVHKNIWLLTDNGRKLIRPYQILSHIVDTFKDKRIGNLGKIHFDMGQHIVVNEQFEGFRVVAKITEF